MRLARRSPDASVTGGLIVEENVMLHTNRVVVGL
jgi:hypothetical protein